MDLLLINSFNFILGHSLPNRFLNITETIDKSSHIGTFVHERVRRDISPAKDYEEGQTVESLFHGKRHCRILFAVGTQFDDISRQYCLELCSEQTSCQSILFKEDKLDIGKCHLSTETRYDVPSSLFTCNDKESKFWHYCEKLPDYFLIFNKETGKILNAKDENQVEMSLTEDEKSFWFWSRSTVRSRKYPDKVLTVNVPTAGNTDRDISLGTYKGRDTQKWTNSDYKVKSISGGSTDRLLSVNAQNKIIAASVSSDYLQHWSLSLKPSYFIITSRGSGTVLTADDKNNGRIMMWEYHGEDNQLWFWDDENIRSKKFPDKVLQAGSCQGAQVKLAVYVNNNKLQSWTADSQDDTIKMLSPIHNYFPKLCVENFSTNNNTKVIRCRNNRYPNDKWTFSSSRMYFFIIHKTNGKVITASSQTSVSLGNYDLSDEKQWFWDSDVIRSKRYTDRVLTLNTRPYIKVGLEKYHGNINQRWIYEDKLIKSKVNDMKLQIKNGRLDASQISYEKWGVGIAHDYFTVWNKHYGTALDINQSDLDIITNPYSGEDSQRWFWDEENIRSKQYPHKVLTIKLGNENRVVTYITEYDGSPRQNWIHINDTFISDFEGRKLSLRRKKSAKVIACKNCGTKEKIRWGYSSQKINYIGFYHKNTEKVLVWNPNANFKDAYLEELKNGEGKYWFWEGANIRSKPNPKCVLTLKRFYLNWYLVKCDKYRDPPSEDFLQRWMFDKDHYVYPQGEGFQLRTVSAKNTIIYGYSIPGLAPSGGLQMFSPKEAEKQQKEVKESCINKVEAKIYSVIQWIPFISTLWDLGSSIGYAAAGCKEVAQERAISLAIGAATDVLTAVTFGAAAAPLAALKTGAKIGIKLGVKAGIKGTISVAKASVKSAIKKAVKLGFKEGLKKAVKKTGVFIAKETIIDPALFLKNIGKVAKNLLFRPKKSFLQFIKTAQKRVDNLKKLKKKLIKQGKVKNVCKRAPICLGRRVTDSTISDATRKFDELLGKTPEAPEIETAAERYISYRNTKGNNVVNNLEEYQAFKTMELELPANSPDTNNLIEKFAVSRYQRKSAVNRISNALHNPYSRKFPFPKKSEEFKRIKEYPEELFNEYYHQAMLIQSYVKKNPMAVEEGGFVKLTRWEPLSIPDNYKVGGTFTSHGFYSTSKSNSRRRVMIGEERKVEARPRVLTIQMRRSGSDISGISRYLSHQEEVLFPFGTKFNVVSKQADVEDGHPITRILLDEILPPT